VAFLIIGFAVTETVRGLRKHFPERKVLAPALYILLTAGYVALQFDALSTVYASFKATGDTMEMYEGVRTFLKKYDKRHAVLLMDPLAYKSTPLKVYLETDGWKTEAIAGIRPRTVKRLNSGQLIDLLHRQRDSYLQSDSNKTVLGLLSTGVSRALLTQNKSESYVGCIVDLSPNQNVPAHCYDAEMIRQLWKRYGQHHREAVTEETDDTPQKLNENDFEN
jgi:hypothetical protein